MEPPSGSLANPTPVSHDVASTDLTDDWMPHPEHTRSVARDLREIVRDELWVSRGLIYEFVRRDIRVRYKQSVLGFAWAVLTPTLIVLAGVLVRYAMAYVGGQTLSLQDLAGIAVKAVPWSFFAGALGFATTSLAGHANLVTKIYFPREVLPLAATLAQAFDSGIAGLTLLIAFGLLGVHYGIAALWAPVLLACIFLMTAGLALLVSCANLFFRDVKYLVHVAVTFGIFFTPVFFEPQMFGVVGARIMMLNPLAPLMEGIRLSLVFDHNLLDPMFVARDAGSVLVWSPWYLGYSVAWAILIFVAGLVLFHRAEPKFAEYV